jgi:hypothetical protein
MEASTDDDKIPIKNSPISKQLRCPRDKTGILKPHKYLRNTEWSDPLSSLNAQNRLNCCTVTNLKKITQKRKRKNSPTFSEGGCTHKRQITQKELHLKFPAEEIQLFLKESREKLFQGRIPVDDKAIILGECLFLAIREIGNQSITQRLFKWSGMNYEPSKAQEIQNLFSRPFDRVLCSSPCQISPKRIQKFRIKQSLLPLLKRKNESSQFAKEKIKAIIKNSKKGKENGSQYTSHEEDFNMLFKHNELELEIGDIYSLITF